MSAPSDLLRLPGLPEQPDTVVEVDPVGSAGSPFAAPSSSTTNTSSPPRGSVGC